MTANVFHPYFNSLLWTIPRPDGRADLIVNKQTRQWGTEYDPRLDLGRTPLRTTTVGAPIEEFTISIVPKGANLAILRWNGERFSGPRLSC